MQNELKGVKVGYCLTGSFCTFDKSIAAARQLAALGAELVPVMSFNARNIDTRFGRAEDFARTLTELSGRQVIASIEDAEPIGPKRLCDIMAVAPCTANTLAKLAMGVTDTPVTMAVKSHLRNGLPVVIAVSTNDALAGAAKNIGALQNYRNYYFVPYTQDSFEKKPASIVADFSLLPETLAQALGGRQLQPLLLR